MITRKVSYLNHDVHYLLLCSCLLVENICSKSGGGGGGGGGGGWGILLIKKKKKPFAPGTQNEISGKFSPPK